MSKGDMHSGMASENIENENLCVFACLNAITIRQTGVISALNR
jgi:hypothetical protein